MFLQILIRKAPPPTLALEKKSCNFFEQLTLILSPILTPTCTGGACARPGHAVTKTVQSALQLCSFYWQFSNLSHWCPCLEGPQPQQVSLAQGYNGVSLAQEGDVMGWQEGCDGAGDDKAWE